ncbi:globin-like protein [Polyplosphaeria fusca]|uniref:nitric oxide dioxygenase n=1 Tax=Polyplosphaeria fusca TaxID=682080 RepID=A0A9P4QXF6_9PLEO|nr:globin-like protein [Polyplosphaeria fusca]
MAPALTPAQAATIKATVPVLAQYGEIITTKFYADLLASNPSLKNIFNTTHQATGHQPRALAGALYAYAANIDNLGALSPAVELICHKHASLYIQPHHYEIVGTNLLATIKAVLGDAATPDIMDAWAAAYWQLADLMIAREAQLYAEAPNWTDWKDFRIARKERESDEITSFYFEPVEEGFEVPVYRPGQYISVNVFVDELDGGVWQARQYSLSDAPGKGYLRISVKKEGGVDLGDAAASKAHAGYISNILHEKKEVGDVVRLSHPYGDFFYEKEEADEESPVVLVSAGVGITPLMSILSHLTANEPKRPITWIHAARNAQVRAFKPHIDGLAAANKNLKTVLFTADPSDDEVQGEHYDVKGRLDLEKLGKERLYAGHDKTQYYTCGPTQFMLDVEAKLNSFGVPSERIKMELFGTGGIPRV